MLNHRATRLGSGAGLRSRAWASRASCEVFTFLRMAHALHRTAQEFLRGAAGAVGPRALATESPSMTAGHGQFTPT